MYHPRAEAMWLCGRVYVFQPYQFRKAGHRSRRDRSSGSCQVCFHRSRHFCRDSSRTRWNLNQTNSNKVSKQHSPPAPSFPVPLPPPTIPLCQPLPPLSPPFRSPLPVPHTPMRCINEVPTFVTELSFPPRRTETGKSSSNVLANSILAWTLEAFIHICKSLSLGHSGIQTPTSHIKCLQDWYSETFL